jgi:hypothetical protein
VYDFAPAVSGLLAVCAALRYPYVTPPTVYEPGTSATDVAPVVSVETFARTDASPLPVSEAFA